MRFDGFQYGTRIDLLRSDQLTAKPSPNTNTAAAQHETTN
jgi:hypothetical protein